MFNMIKVDSNFIGKCKTLNVNYKDVINKFMNDFNSNIIIHNASLYNWFTKSFPDEAYQRIEVTKEALEYNLANLSHDIAKIIEITALEAKEKTFYEVTIEHFLLNLTCNNSSFAKKLKKYNIDKEIVVKKWEQIIQLQKIGNNSIPKFSNDFISVLFASNELLIQQDIIKEIDEDLYLTALKDFDRLIILWHEK